METAADTAHAYVRVAGHGLRFVPIPPYTLLAVATGLDVVAEIDGLEQHVPVTPNAPRGTFAHGAVDDGPAETVWQVEVGGVYCARWPTALQLRSWPEPTEPPFFAFGDGAGSVVYPQGPFVDGRAPTLDGMVYEGQQILGRGADGALSWIDLSYDHDGTAWQQRHILAPLPPGRTMVVTVQTRGAAAADLVSIGLDVARSLRPYIARQVPRQVPR